MCEAYFGILLVAARAINAMLLLMCKLPGSPVMDGIKMRYESVLFDGSFMNKSIYQQSAGPEVDEAWSGLGIDCEMFSLCPVNPRANLD